MYNGMRKREWLLVTVLSGCYLATWIGGWVSHAREIETRAWRTWNDATSRNREMERLAAASQPHHGPIELCKGGPHTGVGWCFPILPGVLVADSYYTVGPLWAAGGVKLVLFYGFGSTELVTIFGWVS